MRDEKEITALKEVKSKLKECKDEWLETNQKGQPALGVSTVQQILDYAVEGVSQWDFIVEEQWREEVMKLPKGATQYVFDGYVYHVRGVLIIDGIGRRTQFGSKVAIGGKDNQNSSYKAAASDCLKKCASLFGVGSSIYSKIKVESDEQVQTYNQVDNSYQQQTQQAQPQQYTNQYGHTQQGEYVWYNNQWVHQNDYYTQLQQAQQQQTGQAGQYPTSPQLTEEQQRDQWRHDTMQQYDPKTYSEIKGNYAPSPAEQLDQAIAQANQEVASGTMDFPFENVAPSQQQLNPNQAQAQPQQATQQAYEAQPQGVVQAQEFKAVEYGAPVDPKGETSPQPEVKKEDPLAHVVANNPWNSLENQASMEMFKQHKTRLNINNEADLLPHIREFFKDATATPAMITPETLIGFNEHLNSIQV